MNVTRGTTPAFAQWNYRIMCHPIKGDLPTNRLRVIDEFGRRMNNRLTLEQLAWTRQARFQLNMKDQDRWHPYFPRGEYGLLDKLMAEIPGKDNYPGNLVDDAFNLPAVRLDTSSANDKVNKTLILVQLRKEGKGSTVLVSLCPCSNQIYIIR